MVAFQCGENNLGVNGNESLTCAMVPVLQGEERRSRGCVGRVAVAAQGCRCQEQNCSRRS